ncbi:hypothetical protein DPMN_148100 [Dreissena polymorpha]|uniref:Uncharacterized protein n=1 Tax=Dreissena polymorpha TaxID=45954 RepID=A0A9D4FBU5_DREPO|nr:hypothetical protein DPMN_148100 [Dreissena polymorpha]
MCVNVLECGRECGRECGPECGRECGVQWIRPKNASTLSAIVTIRLLAEELSGSVLAIRAQSPFPFTWGDITNVPTKSHPVTNSHRRSVELLTGRTERAGWSGSTLAANGIE